MTYVSKRFRTFRQPITRNPRLGGGGGAIIVGQGGGGGGGGARVTYDFAVPPYVTYDFANAVIKIINPYGGTS